MEARKVTMPSTQVQRALAAPRGHEELAPEVDDHGEEEQLDGPQVAGVDVEADVETGATTGAP